MNKCITCKNNILFIARNVAIKQICLIGNNLYKKCNGYNNIFDGTLSVLEVMEKLYLICSRCESEIYQFDKNNRKEAMNLHETYMNKIKYILDDEKLSLYSYRYSYIKQSYENKLCFLIKEIVEKYDQNCIYIHLYYILLGLDSYLFSKFNEELNSKMLVSRKISKEIVNDINKQDNDIHIFLKPAQKLAEYMKINHKTPNHPNNIKIKYKTQHYLFPSHNQKYSIIYNKIHEDLFKDDLIIGLSPLSMYGKDLNFDIRESYGEQYFRIRENIDNYEYHKKVAKEIVQELVNKNSNIIVLPELAVPPSFVDEIRQIVNSIDKKQQPLLVIAGTFHSKNIDSNTFHNEATIITNLTSKDIFQHKLGVFEVKEQDSIEHKKEREKYINSETTICNKKNEYLRYGAKEDVEIEPFYLNIIDTNDFRIAILICSDFITDDTFELLKEYMPNLVIVSSWQGNLNPKFNRNAELLSELNKTTTIISNHCCIQKKDRVVGEVIFPIIPKLENKDKVKLRCNPDCSECKCLKIISIKEII